jgi:hypothetical protein
MNPIAICLDLVLISLLLLAVWIGFRLEKRLKVLRGSQEGFVNAVAELNAGVERAQSGLAELKAATLEARTELADRIQDARGIGARLERQAAAAEAAARSLEGVIERASALRPMAFSSARPREGGDPGVLSDRAAREEPLMLRREALANAQEKGLGPRLRGDERRVERSRARIDDDLFELPGARR